MAYTPVVSEANKTPLKEYCASRFKKFPAPCRSCKYRSLVERDFCIFGNCPRDWDDEKGGK